MQDLPFRAREAVLHPRELLQVASQCAREEGQRRSVARQESLHVHGIGRAKGAPSRSCEFALRIGDCVARRPQRRQFIAAHPTEVLLDADHAEARARIAETIQDLNELKLIEEIVLEPQDYFVMRIQGLIAFFNERVDIEMDGELVERPETQWSIQGRPG